MSIQTHMRRPRVDRVGQPGTQRRRTAHTLVEILLALGLSLVILVAVYGALDQHWRYAEAGQRQTERMQVTRALFERLSLDLRSTVWRNALTSERWTVATSAPRRLIGTPSEEAYVGHRIGLRGDAATLTVQITAPGAEGSPRSQIVHWKMHSLGNVQRAKSATSAAGEVSAAPPEAERTGLVRVVQETTGGAALTDQTLLAPRDVLAPEVASLRFRYFSRGNWFERWDSRRQRALPDAVEITIGFRRPQAGDPQPDATTADDQATAGEYQLVVPIPAAEA